MATKIKAKIPATEAPATAAAPFGVLAVVLAAVLLVVAAVVVSGPG